MKKNPNGDIITKCRFMPTTPVVEFLPEIHYGASKKAHII